MNKSILKTCIPLQTKIFPIYFSEEDAAWWYDSGSLMVNLRAVITDYPHMESDLENTVLSLSTSLIDNHSFEIPIDGSGSIPSSWSGNWYDWRAVDNSALSESYPYGFEWFWHPRADGNAEIFIPWKTAYSQSVLTKNDLNNLSRTLIVSGSFSLNADTEYFAGIRFMSNNGYCQLSRFEESPIEPIDPIIDPPKPPRLIDGAYFPQPPSEENTYLITIGNVNITIDMPNEGSSYWENKFYKLEADYGAVIIYSNDNFNLDKHYKVVGFNRGKTTDELEDNASTNPIWKTYTTSFTPEVTGVAYMYIYNRHVKTPAYYDNYIRPQVFVDYAIVNTSSPYILQDIGSAENPINMDSYSYFEADSPITETEIINLEFLASDITSTGCTITVSGSTTYGFYTPGLLDSNDSYTLKFGKDDDEVIWASWMPFTTTAFNDLTEGVRITSASLTFVATKDITSSPTKTCYITTGLEKTNYNVSPSTPTSYSAIKNKPIANQLNTALLNSCITGEAYDIDITNSVKEQLGKKAISWGNASIAALVKNNNSNIGGYREVASGSHLAYTVPKLTIGYVRNGYPKNSLATSIKKSNQSINYYTSQYIRIGGSTSASTVSRGLIYFNLGTLPAGTINSATLMLHQVYTNEQVSSQTINVYPVSGAAKWDYYGTTWLKRFGAGGNSNWNTAGGDSGATLYASGSEIAPLLDNNIGVWRDIVFTGAGKTALSNMRSNPSTNNGFLIIDSSESSSNMVKYCSSNHTWVNPSGQWARPMLKVEIDNVFYYLQYTGPSEDAVADSPTDPEPPVNPPPASLPVAFVKKQWLETGSNGNTISHTIIGAKDTNRYLLISEGFDVNNNEWMWDAYFSSITYGGVNATRIIDAGFTGVDSNESRLIMWGVVIPNNWAPNLSRVLQGVKHYGAAGGNRSIPLCIREFSHVNSNSPVFRAVSYHNNVNSAIQCKEGGLQIQYPAKGYVADAVFLSNNSEDLGYPQRVFTHQIIDLQTWTHACSRYKTSSTTSGVINMNWHWNRQEGVPFGNSGSDNCLAIVSLNPE